MNTTQINMNNTFRLLYCFSTWHLCFTFVFCKSCIISYEKIHVQPYYVYIYIKPCRIQLIVFCNIPKLIYFMWFMLKCVQSFLQLYEFWQPTLLNRFLIFLLVLTKLLVIISCFANRILRPVTKMHEIQCTKFSKWFCTSRPTQIE